MINSIESAIDISERPYTDDIPTVNLCHEAWIDLAGDARRAFPAGTKFKWRARITCTIEFIPDDRGMGMDDLDAMSAK
jgi:hypothetical protein